MARRKVDALTEWTEAPGVGPSGAAGAIDGASEEMIYGISGDDDNGGGTSGGGLQNAETSAEALRRCVPMGEG